MISQSKDGCQLQPTFAADDPLLLTIIAPDGATETKTCTLDEAPGLLSDAHERGCLAVFCICPVRLGIGVLDARCYYAHFTDTPLEDVQEKLALDDVPTPTAIISPDGIKGLEHIVVWKLTDLIDVGRVWQPGQKKIAEQFGSARFSRPQTTLPVPGFGACVVHSTTDVILDDPAQWPGLPTTPRQAGAARGKKKATADDGEGGDDKAKPVCPIVGAMESGQFDDAAADALEAKAGSVGLQEMGEAVTGRAPKRAGTSLRPDVLPNDAPNTTALDVLFCGGPDGKPQLLKLGALPGLRTHRGEFYKHGPNHPWMKLPTEELEADIRRHLGGRQYYKRKSNGTTEQAGIRVTRQTVGEAVAAIKALQVGGKGFTKLARSVQQPDRDAPYFLIDPKLLGLGEDANPRDFVAFSNCVVRISTGQRYNLILAESIFGIRFIPIHLPEVYEPPVGWCRFLKQLWPKDVDADQILALQLWFAYVLSGRTDLHKLLLLVGPPRSGKSTIARVLMAMIGLMNVASPTLASLAGQFGMAPLIGKMLAVIADARLSGRADQAAIMEVLLAIVGEDSVTINRKFLEPIVTTLHSLFLIISNEIPRLADTSGALVARTIMIRITESFMGKENTKLTQELLGELPQIVGWALAGVPLLKEHKGLIQPTGSAELLGELKELGSPISTFVVEKCVLGTDKHVTKAGLFGAWKTWCFDNGREGREGAAQTFSRDLRAAYPQITDRRDWEPGQDSSKPRPWQWHGIGLIADEVGQPNLPGTGGDHA